MQPVDKCKLASCFAVGIPLPSAPVLLGKHWGAPLCPRLASVLQAAQCGVARLIAVWQKSWRLDRCCLVVSCAGVLGAATPDRPSSACSATEAVLALPPQTKPPHSWCCFWNNIRQPPEGSIARAAASASMVLLNKATLSSFAFQSPISLLMFQCLVCVLLVRFCHAVRVIKLEPWSFAIARLWFPVNVIFVGMIWTSFFALKSLGVPMATVLKNMTNLFTICGDYLLYGKTYGVGVWLTLALMTVSAVCGAATDLAFSLEVRPGIT